MAEIIRDLAPVDAMPEKIILDFELSPIKAFKQAFPLAEITLCNFHLNQSVIRKLSTLGLKCRYTDDEEYNEYVKSLAALAFVPPAHVPSVYDKLKSVFPEDQASDELLQYFETTYIKGVPLRNNRQRPPTYPHELWNQFQNSLDGLPRTNNASEGFNNAFKCLLNCDHPSVWLYFDAVSRDIGIQKKSLLMSAQVSTQQRKKNTSN